MCDDSASSQSALPEGANLGDVAWWADWADGGGGLTSAAALGFPKGDHAFDDWGCDAEWSGGDAGSL